MSEISQWSEFSDDRKFSKSSEYSHGPKIDKTYSEYSDGSENSRGSKVSGSNYSDDSKTFANSNFERSLVQIQ